VDPAGILERAPDLQDPQDPAFTRVETINYATPDDARQALDSGTIQGYYVIPANYPRSRNIEVIFNEEPDGRITNHIRGRLRRVLLADLPPQVSERVLEGPQLEMIATAEDRQVRNNDWFKIVAPIVAGIFLVISVFTSSGYLMQAVVEEKENRTMEILATSVSPGQIMSGKIIALIAVGLTQVFVWALFPLIALLAARAYLPFLQDVQINWGTIGMIVLLALPTFVLISALMATVGAAVTEAREGQQVSGLIAMPVWIPFMLMGVLINNPGSPIAIFFSFFPLTAALTVLIRYAFSSVPSWQIAVSAGILIVTAVGSLWLAGRVFRLGMLRYGQRMNWKEIFRATRRAE
jgi:ABC-2 type transport system permease protein